MVRATREIGEIERRIGAWHGGNAGSRQVAKIPGVGVLTARPPSPRWAIRRRSGRAGSSPPGSA